VDPIAIVTPFDPQTRAGFSHLLVSEEIRSVFEKEGKTTKIYHYESKKIEEPNILFVGTITASTLAYLSRFLPEKKIVFYATVEGFPIVNPMSLEREVARKIKVVAVSDYVKLCIETAMLQCDGVVHHGIDMGDASYDQRFHDWISDSWVKKDDVVLCVSGNMPRKGLDKFMAACSVVRGARSGTKFILHTGAGSTDIDGLANTLGLDKDCFWFTNAFGVLEQPKMNALYKLAKAYVQPSYCEGFGLPMIEALRFQVPVVAVDAPPFNEIISKGRSGTLIPCTDVKQLVWGNQISLNMHQYRVHDLAGAIVNTLRAGINLKMKKAIASERERFGKHRLYPRLLPYFEEPPAEGG